MSFTASIQYTALLDPTQFNITDTSNYASPDSKANISARTLTILQSNNLPLPGFPNPINFPYSGGDTFNITGLTADVALQIVMNLTPITPNAGSIYVATADIATTRFLQLGLFNIQVQKNNSPYVSDAAQKIYRDNSIDIIIETSNSQTALQYADLTGSQNALTIGQNIINNTQL